MRKFTFIAVFIVLLLALAACGGPVAKLDQADNGTSLDLKTGETFTVSLEGNPTTGYSWEVAGIEPAVVALVGEPDYKSDSNLIGSGGMFKFTFKAAAPGTSSVKLVYHRPWEEDVEPLEVFEVTVNVK
jgi:inhibitor of cysteine peptidase